LDYDNYPVSRNGTCNATEQLEELAKTEGFQGVNDLDEEKTSLPTGEGTHLNSCMKTLHAPSMQESCAYLAMKIALEKDSGESMDLQFSHTLLGTSPVTTGDALPSPGVNPLEGSPKCSCGKLGLGRRSRLPAL